MKFPKSCPICGKEFGWIELDHSGGGVVEHNFLMRRGELDFDRDDPDRIADEIHECNSCHGLLRFRWKLISIHKLIEEEVQSSTGSMKNE